MTDAGEQLPRRQLEILQPAIEHRCVVQRLHAAVDQLIDRPLTARPVQLRRHLTQQRLVITRQSLTQAFAPGGGINQRHV
jgi:hypothetical protein